jgi:cysteine desulfurase
VINRRWIYADYNATTPLEPVVLEAMLPWISGLSANPSSVHGPGRQARKVVEEARALVASAIGAEPSEIVFTSGGTEADNLAVAGGARALRKKDPSRVRVMISAAEHPAVWEPARGLQEEGFLFSELPARRDSCVDLEPAMGMLGGAGARELALVSVILANNETGAVNTRLSELLGVARERGALTHSDAVQAVGKVPVDVKGLGVDLLSLTAHKFGGPKGAGALFVRRGVAIAPLMKGGAQEKGRRGGTENVAAIVGLGAAIQLAGSNLAREAARLSLLRDEFEERLRRVWPLCRVNSQEAERIPGVSSVTFPGIDAETLVIALDLEGVAISTGAACSSGTVSASRVLLACGFPVEEVRSTVRFSFGSSTDGGAIDSILEALTVVLGRMRSRVLP